MVLFIQAAKPPISRNIASLPFENMDSDVSAPRVAPAPTLLSVFRIFIREQLSFLRDISFSGLSDISISAPQSWQPTLKKLYGAPGTDPALRNILTIILGVIGAILIIYIFPYSEVENPATLPLKEDTTWLGPLSEWSLDTLEADFEFLN
ncbi:hypothetical protein QTJ16_001490 [Diplocarpon rosae]|uniref:Uncharacterized protein n=1 Tax=Diplocarpon rosae TaxID=946125 RepID=A0AAD9T482_9HELO|nr:hypothetical protein QTJ16_001490 [Diplocarpon rosae]